MKQALRGMVSVVVIMVIMVSKAPAASSRRSWVHRDVLAIRIGLPVANYIGSEPDKRKRVEMLQELSNLHDKGFRLLRCRYHNVPGKSYEYYWYKQLPRGYSHDELRQRTPRHLLLAVTYEARTDCPQPDGTVRSGSEVLVAELAGAFDISDAQARAGAGAVLLFIRHVLGPERFQTITDAIPGLQALVSSAPALTLTPGSHHLELAVKQRFQELGLPTQRIRGFASMMQSYVRADTQTAEGLSEAAMLFESALSLEMVIPGAEPKSYARETTKDDAFTTEGFFRPEILSGIYHGQFDLPHTRYFVQNYLLRMTGALDRGCADIGRTALRRRMETVITREYMGRAIDPHRTLAAIKEFLEGVMPGGTGKKFAYIASKEEIEQWARQDSDLFISRYGCESAEMKRFVTNLEQFMYGDTPTYYTSRDHGTQVGLSLQQACVQQHMRRATTTEAKKRQFCDCLVTGIIASDLSAEDKILLATNFNTNNMQMLWKKYPRIKGYTDHCWN